MTRAVIELSGDISPFMPIMSRVIDGCAHNPETNLMAFRFRNMPVVVESHRIIVNYAEDEIAVKTLMDWLKDVMNTNNGVVGKRELN